MTDAERRASEAKALLDDGMLKEAFEAIERDAYEELLKTDTWLVNHDRVRAALIDRINAIRDLRAHLQSVITTGTQSARRAPAVA